MEPQDVYANENLAPEYNVDFLKRCARWIPAINFADYDTGRVYARLQRGKWIWRDEARFAEMLKDPDARAGLLAVAPKTYDPNAAPAQKRMDVAFEKVHTLGAWGEAAARRVRTWFPRA